METHKFNQKRTIVPNQLGPTQNSVITPKDRPADQAQTASSTQPPTHNAGPAVRHPAPPLEKNPTCKNGADLGWTKAANSLSTNKRAVFYHISSEREGAGARRATAPHNRCVRRKNEASNCGLEPITETPNAHDETDPPACNALL